MMFSKSWLDLDNGLVNHELPGHLMVSSLSDSSVACSFSSTASNSSADISFDTYLPEREVNTGAPCKSASSHVRMMVVTHVYFASSFVSVSA